MSLIIFYSISCTKNVGCGTNDIRVRPMFFMKWRTDIKRIICSRRDSYIPAQLYVLFSPITNYCYTKNDKYISPIRFIKNRCIQYHVKIHQRKQMPPNKLQQFLCFEPKLLPTMSHFILLPWDQNITTSTKHPLSIISKDRTLSIHEWPTFEGRQIHEFS